MIPYHPGAHTASNTPYGTTNKPDSARSYFFDEGETFNYRQFMSLQEILDYFPNEADRRGHVRIILNTGGTIRSDGMINGGINEEYWWKDGYADDDLVIKESGGSATNILQLTISDLESDKKTYIDTTLKDKTFYLWLSNTQSFLAPGSDTFNVLPDGGFELIYTLPDDAFILLFGGLFAGGGPGGGSIELYNALDRITPGMALDAVQGKVLFDMIGAVGGPSFEYIIPDEDGYLDV